VQCSKSVQCCLPRRVLPARGKPPESTPPNQLTHTPPQLDVWSLGASAYDLMVGHAPFQNQEESLSGWRCLHPP
jgi:serine/threonine protein kinase